MLVHGVDVSSAILDELPQIKLERDPLLGNRQYVLWHKIREWQEPGVGG
jgi:hypothetical protein